MTGCGKIGYATLGEARQASRAIESNRGRRLRSYVCDVCGSYHLTSWTRAAERHRRRVLRSQA
jgi:hypothetical protein